MVGDHGDQGEGRQRPGRRLGWCRLDRSRPATEALPSGPTPAATPIRPTVPGAVGLPTASSPVGRAAAALREGNTDHARAWADEGADQTWSVVIYCGIDIVEGNYRAAARRAAASRDEVDSMVMALQGLLSDEATFSCARLLVLSEAWLVGSDALEMLALAIRDDCEGSNTNARNGYRSVLRSDDSTEVIAGIARYCLARKYILADPVEARALPRQLFASSQHDVNALGVEFWDAFSWWLTRA